MNKVSGKIIVKETGVGISNLLIIVYDLDPDSNIDEIFRASTSSANTDFWDRFRGDRIGSVLTSPSGEFELSYEDGEIQEQNEKKGPDLILLVMAPEEPQIINQCTPQSPQNLMLYCSNIARVNAGRAESYLVRLSTEQLEEFNIPYPKAAQGRLPDKDSLISDLDRSYALSDAVRKKLNERTSQRLSKTNEAAQKAKEAFANFNPSKVPAEVRADPTYLKPDDDLFKNQKAIIRRDLKQLSKSKIRRPLRLRLSQEQLDDLELTIDDEGKVSGTVEFDKILSHIEKTMQGAELFRVRSPFEARQMKKEADRIIDEIASGDESD